MTTGDLFNSFEELQLCAIDANAKLKSIYSTRDLSTLLQIFANFIFFRKLDTFLKTESVAPNLFEEWLEICQSTKSNFEFEQVNKTKSTDETATDENERLFKIGFKKKLEQFWTTSKVIQTGLIDYDNPLTTRERMFLFANKLFLSALRGLCAGSDIGVAISENILSHHNFEMLEEAHKEFENIRLKELTHVVESVDEISELAEELPWLGHYLHQLSNGPRKSFEALTGYSYLNTNERIKNFNTSFDHNEDFKDKIESLAAEIIRVYQVQFEKLSPKAAWLLGQACSQHLKRGLMLGLFKSKNISSMSLHDFIATAMQWFSYLPMENPPKLKLKNAGVISADQFLRGPGLRCAQGETEFYFYWDSSMIEALKPYCFYQYQTTFTYQSNPHLLDCRIASEKEVHHLRNHRDLAQQYVLLGNASMPIASLTWRLDDTQINALQETSLDTVSPIIAPEYIPERQRIAKLEQEIVSIKDSIQLLVEQEVKKQMESIRAENEALKMENQELKNKYAENEKQKNPYNRLGLF